MQELRQIINWNFRLMRKYVVSLIAVIVVVGASWFVFAWGARVPSTVDIEELAGVGLLALCVYIGLVAATSLGDRLFLKGVGVFCLQNAAWASCQGEHEKARRLLKRAERLLHFKQDELHAFRSTVQSGTIPSGDVLAEVEHYLSHRGVVATRQSYIAWLILGILVLGTAIFAVIYAVLTGR